MVRQESVKLKPGETTKDPQFVHLHKAQTGAPNHRRARRQPKVCPAGYLMILKGYGYQIYHLFQIVIWLKWTLRWNILVILDPSKIRFAMFCPHYYCNAWHFQFSAARKCTNYDPQRLTIRHHDVSSRHSFGPHPIVRNTCALNVLISPAHLMYKRLQLPTKDPAIPQLTSAKI